MTKFKKHEGKLFRILDKPVPLTPDAEMPCLVQLIQDDSPMGKHNKDLHAFDPGRLMPKICTEIIDVNDLSDPNRGNAICDGFMSIQYYRYELIGTFVKDGSKEWALYQMMQGETVTFLDYPNRTLKLVNGYIQDSISDGFWNRKSGNEFLSYASSTGWQIYKEPEPKYKIGDWVECVAKQGQRKLVDYLGGMECYKTNYGEVISPGEILRKLSPSDVVFHIGCLSGTVDAAITLRDAFYLKHSDGSYSLISFTALDTRTRELVESLLEAMRGEEK